MMSDERYVRKEYAIWDTYLDREVQKLNHRYQCNHICEILNKKENIIQKLESENEVLIENLSESEKQARIFKKEYYERIINYQKEIKRLWKLIWKIQWRFEQEVGIEKAREHYQEIDEEMKE